jgi:hypothetical protein
VYRLLSGFDPSFDLRMRVIGEGALAALDHNRVKVDQVRDPVWEAVCRPGNWDAPEAVPDKYDFGQLFALDELNQIFYERADGDGFAQKMCSVAHAG